MVNVSDINRNGESLMNKSTGNSRAAKNKQVRKEALRDQLSAQGHVQHVIDISDKLSKLTEDLEPAQVQRLKAAADIKLKLISKYLPDLKAIEHTGEDGGDISLAVRYIATDK